jgi:RecA-family ATPase
MTDARGEWFREMDQDAVAGDQPDPAPDPPDLRETDYADAPDDIPPRGWLLGNLLCRQFLTGIFGDGATGKTALLVAMALSLATGLALIGEHVFERGRVAVLCFEDGKAELLRRLRAACLHYGIQKSELRGWLFVDAVMAPDLKLAVQARDRLAEGLLSGALSRLIDRRRLDAVLLDPLVKTHQVAENDNTAMDFVSTILAELAVRHDVAIGVAHHTRKGSPDPGNADIGRGGGALKDAFRLCYTQTAMQKEEADRLCISDDERASLVRVDYGKVNLVRRSPDAHWFRLIGVPLGNRTETYPHGDEVQTVVRWTPPDYSPIPATRC